MGGTTSTVDDDKPAAGSKTLDHPQRAPGKQPAMAMGNIGQGDDQLKDKEPTPGPTLL